MSSIYPTRFQQSKLIQFKFTKVIVFVFAVKIQFHDLTKYLDDTFICCMKEE